MDSINMKKKKYITDMDELKMALQKNSYLSKTQKKVLNVLLDSNMYFLSYCFDENWDLMYSDSKTYFVQKLFDGLWDMSWMETHCEDHIYAIQFIYKDLKKIQDFAFHVLTDHVEEKYKKIEVYVSLTEFEEIKKIIDLHFKEQLERLVGEENKENS
ncbi:hypothetical protein COL77_30550 [Bacillus wiedmannii]|nr:hypothetical protein COL77_30550 [Bacillus wiedmannii]